MREGVFIHYQLIVPMMLLQSGTQGLIDYNTVASFLHHTVGTFELQFYKNGKWYYISGIADDVAIE